MKKIIVVCTLLMATLVYSQDEVPNEFRSLVDNAISLISDDYYKYYQESGENNVRDIIYVIAENGGQVNLSNVKSQLLLKTIDINDKRNRKLLKKGLKVWKINFVIIGNLIKIHLINFGVKYENNNYQYVNAGISTAFFQYSCTEERWKFIKVEHNGI